MEDETRQRPDDHRSRRSAEPTGGRDAGGVRQSRTEQTLRESEERYRLIVESARDYAILTVDLDGRIKSWSPGAAAVFGWRAEEALGRPASMTFTPEDRASGQPEKELATARREGSAPDVRWHLRKDRARVFIEGTVRSLHDDGGGVRGFLKIGQDVTGRKLAEAALRESEARFRAVADLVPDLLWQNDPAGVRTWGNRRWMEYTGQTPDEALGHGWAGTIHPDDREGALAAYREALHSGEPFRHEHRLRRADGAFRMEDEDLRVLLFQIVRELLFNVKKHAGVDRATVTIREEAGHVVVEVADTRRGFDPAKLPQAKGFGLYSVQERLYLLGGHLEVESRPGEDTRVKVHAPPEPPNDTD